MQTRPKKIAKSAFLSSYRFKAKMAHVYAQAHSLLESYPKQMIVSYHKRKDKKQMRDVLRKIAKFNFFKNQLSLKQKWNMFGLKSKNGSCSNAHFIHLYICD